MHYEGDPIVVVDHPPPTVEAVRVQNSGNWYNPPTTHLGKNLVTKYPVEIAELGIKFYEEFLNEAEAKFFQRQHPD